jgi:hypothetical protein
MEKEEVMNPFFHLKRCGRILLVGITLVSFIKCLVFPNTLDVLILVALLMLLTTTVIGNGKCL